MDKLMEGIAQDTSASSYEFMTPFRMESLCQNERKPVSEFISSGFLTLKNLVSEKAYAFLFLWSYKRKIASGKSGSGEWDTTWNNWRGWNEAWDPAWFAAGSTPDTINFYF